MVDVAFVVVLAVEVAAVRCGIVGIVDVLLVSLPGAASIAERTRSTAIVTASRNAAGAA